MSPIVYWSGMGKNKVWHLYKDCPKFLCLPAFQKSGTPEEAISSGCNALCPVCRTRHERENASADFSNEESNAQTISVVPAEHVGHFPSTSFSSSRKTLITAVISAVIVLVLSSFYYNGKFQDDLEAARLQGYDTGYTEGTQTGYTNGYETGYAEGSDVGHDAGYAEGSAAGYDAGYSEGEDAGYTKGHDEGYATGLTEGNEQGYDEGYEKGYADGKQTAAAAAPASPSGSSGEKAVNSPAAQETSTTVYITETGSKYHRSGCSYLKKSCISISLSSAKAQNYTPCSRCNPPA